MTIFSKNFLGAWPSFGSPGYYDGSPANFSFSFFTTEALSILECFYIKTAVFELVQQFYHATEISNVANAVSSCADQP